MTLPPTPASLQNHLQPQLARHRLLGLLPRLIALGFLFVAELLVLSVWLDNSVLIARGGILAFVGEWAASTVRAIVGFTAIFVTFAYLKHKSVIASLSIQVEQAPVNVALLVTHLLAMALFGELCRALYGNQLAAIPPGISLFLWLVTGIAGIILAAVSVVPRRLWLQLLRDTGSLWVLALVSIILVGVLGEHIRNLWEPLTGPTFLLAKTFLKPFVSGIIADPASRTLGTAKFNVTIESECSGFEGVGLILAFAACWLWLFRRECHFPQALFLLPAGVATIFLLNAARIAALILIGNAGAPQIALGGFHSQAGWITFNLVAFGFCIVATHIPWLTKSGKAVPASAVQLS